MEREGVAWPGGAKLALSLVVNVEEGSEQSVARGDRGMEPVDELGVFVKGPIRNFGNESNYLYGIKAGLPRIVDLLDLFHVPASWTVAARSLEAFPHIGRVIADRGDEPVSHGLRWVHQFRMDEEAERAFIREAAQSIARTTGQRPTGWLSRYLHTPATRRLLIEEGYRWHMDDYSGDVPFWDRETVPGRPMVILPYALDSNDMKMWTDPAYTPGLWLDYARHSFDRLLAEGEAGTPRMMSLGLHLRIIGRPGRIWALEEFLRHVRARGDAVWVTTRGAIAGHFAATCPA
jgi:peptidoglycan/xylan/chitin deacetylase (PgdA/CDA1 family)